MAPYISYSLGGVIVDNCAKAELIRERFATVLDKADGES